MTRIIGGAAGSRPLRVPPRGTRPTSDRVREALFSALDARGIPQDARVADLYAGSGALGLEALSRGAASVVLVDASAKASGVARANAATVEAAVGRRGSVAVVTAPVQSWLEGAGAAGGLDLVFLDPPYDLDDAAVERNLASLVPLLSDGAVVLVERSSRSPEPSWPDGLEPGRARTYGETVVWWAEREDADGA